MARALLLVAAVASLARAQSQKAFALPNGQWAGIDGNWSTVSFLLGADSQPVDVLVGTALSEFWAVGIGGCYPNEPHCFEARGGLYRPEDSHLWDDLGTWHLGLDHLGFSGNGRYGFDRARAYSDIQDGRVFTMGETLVSALNTTDHFLGVLGLGIAQGNFESTIARSPLTVAVQDTSLIPSYSYGYTAGAHYRNIPASVTLGGYDKARFVDHTNEFTVSKSDSLLRTLVRGIQVQTSADHDKLEEWDSDVQLLSQMNSSFTALVDTTTPFLYLPNSVCDAFAEAFNMTYHDDIDLYGLSNDQYRDFRKQDTFDFVFSLSSTDNNDDFGEPLNVPGVVNITIPMRAFVSTVEYPFHDEAIAYGEPAQPYFSLRRSGDNETFIIGRSFFQESYLLTQYDKQVFSIHKALFPEDPNEDADIESLEQPDNSPYPPPTSRSNGLSKGEIAGIAVGASVGVVLALIMIWCCWRRRKGTHAHSSVPESEEEKTSTESFKDEVAQSNSPLVRIWAKVVRRKRSNLPNGSRPGDASQPMEAPNTQIYELPAPAAPVELHGDADNNDVDDGDLGLQRGSMSAYEQQRLKLNRQLAGPVPEYTPPSSGAMPPPEKAIYHYEAPGVPERCPVPERHLAPTQGSVSPQGPDSNNSNSFPSNGSMISPVSPGAGWANNSESNYNYNNSNSSNTPGPSPMAREAPQLPLARTQARSDPNLQESSYSYSDRSTSPSGINLHTANVQRTPIDPSNVVCLGPLPENVQLRNQPSLPQIVAPDGTQLNSPSFNREHDDGYDSTLGTDYTREEEERMREYQSQMQASQSERIHPPTQSQDPQEQDHLADSYWLQGQHYHDLSVHPQQQQSFPYPQHTDADQTQQRAISPQEPYYTDEQHQLSQWQLAAQAGKQRLQQQWAQEEEMRRRGRIQSSQQQGTYHPPSRVEYPPQPTHYAQSSQATYAPGRDDEAGAGMMEFIHVPQPAEKRFSWEEDRSTY